MDILIAKAKLSDGTTHVYKANVGHLLTYDILCISLDAECEDGSVHRLADFQVDEGTMSKDSLHNLLSALLDERSETDMSVGDILEFLTSDDMQADLGAIKSIVDETGTMLALLNGYKDELMRQAKARLD